MIKLRLYIPYLAMVDGNAFRIGFPYYFVRHNINQLTDEYWFFPFNSLATAWYFLLDLVFKVRYRLMIASKRAQHAQTKKTSN